MVYLYEYRHPEYLILIRKSLQQVTLNFAFRRSLNPLSQSRIEVQCVTKQFIHKSQKK